jgi:hypothetical protein
MSNWSGEEIGDPTHADRRDFYKVEQWSRDEQRVLDLVFAGSSLNKARRIFDRITKHRPNIRLTIPPADARVVETSAAGRDLNASAPSRLYPAPFASAASTPPPPDIR